MGWHSLHTCLLPTSTSCCPPCSLQLWSQPLSQPTLKLCSHTHFTLEHAWRKGSWLIPWGPRLDVPGTTAIENLEGWAPAFGVGMAVRTLAGTAGSHSSDKWKNIRKINERKWNNPWVISGHELMVQVSLTFPHYILRLCSRPSHCATACGTTTATRLFSWWQPDLWWHCCWAGGSRFASHSSAVCPAHLTLWPKFLCQSLLLAFGKPWHCQVPAPANNSLGAAGVAGALGAQQPLCWSINSRKCLLWSKNLFNQISQQIESIRKILGQHLVKE